MDITDRSHGSIAFSQEKSRHEQNQIDREYIERARTEYDRNATYNVSSDLIWI